MPAAAVIPAPVAYIKSVAVKTLVVGDLLGIKASQPGTLEKRSHFTGGLPMCFSARGGLRIVYFEEIGALQADACH